jgi:prepilin-type N-terminal cleavage/methylation domain-containing protein
MRSKQSGMTLVELMAGVAILSILIFATMNVTTAITRSTKTNMDRQFATQKAISMLEELKALVQVNTGTSITVIDDYNDAGAYRLRLTTQGGDPNSNPGEALSGNLRQGAGWLYSRQISVKPMTDPNDSSILISSNDVRMVRVRVYRNLPDGQRQLMSEVASIVRTLAASFSPSQVYDVYCIAIENVPGWWVNMSTLVTFAQNAVGDLQVRHPGLVFRQRMITTLAYGRDSQYQPYINATQNSKSDIPSVYFYPGLMPDDYDMPAGTGAATNRLTAAQYYYPPANFNGKYRDESGSQNAYAAANSDAPNPYPYALADQYNHAMRYKDERALYELRRDARDAGGNLIYPNLQPTLRLLLDDMIMRPWLYMNAIVINLHGEMLPFPPVRNYSDAAKKPNYYVGTSSSAPNGVRVVTHPEQIAYNTNNATEAASTVNLRVYSYLTHPENGIRKLVSGLATDLNSDATARGEWLPEPITVVLKDFAWTPGAANIQAIAGGVDFDRNGSRDFYSIGNANVSDATSPPAGAHRMYFTTAPEGNDTVIRLYNSPLVAPCATTTDCDAGTDSGGIEHNDWNTNTRRLYGMEYIPAPMENFANGAVQTAFSRNLTTVGDMEKNTARWVIRIPTATFGSSKALTVETYIGNYTWNSSSKTYVSTLSPPYAEPTNLSRTYVWRGDENYLFVGNPAANPKTGPALPPSERYQFQGDPRHCPYADLKRPHTRNGITWAAGNVNTFYGMGYNRYFDGFRDGSSNQRTNWPGWGYTAGSPAVTYGVPDNTNALWNNLDVDIPRVFQIWRTALMRSNALFTTMTGYPFFYIGLGNEIGYDNANGFPSSIPVSRLPFDPSLSSTYRYFEHSIGANPGNRYIQEGDGTTNGWWGMNWLGELYPDTWYDITSGINANNDWKAKGNLPTGTASSYTTGTFRRVRRIDVPGNELNNRSHTPGTTLQASHRNTAQPGIAMFYGAASNSTVDPDCCNDDQPNDFGSLDTGNSPNGGGEEIKNNFNFPLDSPMPAWRPFVINGSVNGTAEGLGQAPYGATTSLSWLRKYYDQNQQGNHASSAAIGVREGTTQNAMFVVANGLSPTGTAGTEYLARWAFLSLIQSYFEAGGYNDGDAPAVAQLPRVVITDPNLNTSLTPETSTVRVQWAISWRRWDGKTYTAAYDEDEFAIGATTSYAIMYSIDNGATWKYVQDDSTASPGVRSSDDDHKISGLYYDWAVPVASFPTGAYIIRVEAYRDEYPLHYSYHQYQMFLNR